MTTKLDEQKVIRLIDEAEDLVNLIGMAIRKGKTHERATIRGVVSQVFDKLSTARYLLQDAQAEREAAW
jgi:hypothetical protein